GLGNDFVVIDQRQTPVALDTALVRAIGNRRWGVGFDQLAEIRAGADTDLEITFWNADGTIAGACGNATRCIASLVLASGTAETVTMRTANGVLAGRTRPDGVVEVDMGAVHLDWQAIPLAHAADTASLPLEGAPGAVNVGNPHAVFFVEDAEAVDLKTLGPRWEHDAFFPEKTNVEFCQVIDAQTIRMRVWERGTGVTEACGSGACAAVVAAARKGLTGRSARVILDGGPLEITWTQDNHILMAGPTASVFEGVLSPDFVADHAG
ncbi:MAG: diaminopimelate epimerase, partial [Pseudomonadota bacterium]